MSTASATPAMGGPGDGGGRPSRAPGATAVGPVGRHGPHRLGNALRAVKVFVVTAFRVTVLGDPGDGRPGRRSPGGEPRRRGD
ncbi:hypothetical protein [Streptomyces sp. WMMC1477]|uniref:hypothetical protein n=1 Tax=unclassified Streptomyces TaxID=2593676 RepID=UPI003FCDBB3C